MAQQLTAGGVSVYRDSAGVLRETPPGGTGASMSAVTTATEMDTQGNPVPVYKAHAFTYDGSGNLATDTVTDGTSTWVRTYTYTNGAQATDSGWVKQ